MSDERRSTAWNVGIGTGIGAVAGLVGANVYGMSKARPPAYGMGAGLGAVLGAIAGYAYDQSVNAPVLLPTYGGPSDLPEWRVNMLARARKHVENRTLYQWGGGRSPTDYGVDCSGMIITCLNAAGVPLPPQGGTSGVWWASLPRVAVPLPGDAAFFGKPEKAVHVTLVEEPLEGGDAMTIGANNGDSKVTTPEEAIARNAYVFRKRAREWSTFLGYCTFDPAARAGKQSLFPPQPVWCCD